MNTSPIDSKKRLEEILKDYIVPYDIDDEDRIDLELQKEAIIECSNLILKDFVHKDNFGEVADSCMYNFPKSYTNSQIKAFQKGIDKMWSALLKLTEGKK